MKILALEFSSSLRGAAVLDTGNGALGVSEEMGGRNIFRLIEAALAQAQVEREEIDVIAVGLGPGSYTGIRGALAVAQGWQLAGEAARQEPRPTTSGGTRAPQEVKVVGVSSVDCLAAQAREEGKRGTVNVIIDAQRGEFYLARFEITSEAARTVEALRLASHAEVAALEGNGISMGPEMGACFPFAVEAHPRAAILARLAAERKEFAPAETLEPIYLRATAFKKAPPPRVVS